MIWYYDGPLKDFLIKLACIKRKSTHSNYQDYYIGCSDRYGDLLSRHTAEYDYNEAFNNLLYTKVSAKEIIKFILLDVYPDGSKVIKY